MSLGVPRALNLAGISFADAASPASMQPRSRVEWAGELGVRAVQLDATMAGMRPRELDRSARRDVASLLRRLELGFAGLDLSIPAAHFADAAMLDRAVQATQEALTLAADLAALCPASAGAASGVGAEAGRVVAITLPEVVAADVLGTLQAHAESCKVMLVDFRWPLKELERPAPGSDGGVGQKKDGVSRAVGASDTGFGVGLDTGTLLVAGLNPAKAIARLATLYPRQPGQLRLSDSAGGRRVALGDGALDEVSVDVACQVAGYRGYAVVDLRGMAAGDIAAARIWSGAGK